METQKMEGQHNSITVDVRRIVGSELGVASSDGQKVFKRIKAALDGEQDVAIAFAGMENLTSAFLNAAIGQLYGFYDEAFLRSHLSVRDMVRGDQILLKRVVENAKRYFADPSGVSEERDRVFGSA